MIPVKRDNKIKDFNMDADASTGIMGNMHVGARAKLETSSIHVFNFKLEECYNHSLDERSVGEEELERKESEETPIEENKEIKRPKHLRKHTSHIISSAIQGHKDGSIARQEHEIKWPKLPLPKQIYKESKLPIQIYKDDNTMSIDDLLSSQEIKDIIPEKSKFTIKINRENDIAKLEGALISNPNAPFFKQIQKLNFEAGLDKSFELIIPLLKTIIANPNLLPSLIGLTFGNIGQNVDFIFLESFKGLAELSFDEIGGTGHLQLPKSFDELKRLSIGKVYGRLIFPESLKGLAELSIYGNLPLPIALNALKRLSIGGVCGQIIFPESLNGLAELSIDEIGGFGTLQLPEFFDELKRLSIGKINGRLIFPESLNGLAELSIGGIYSNLPLPIALNALKRLSIGGVCGQIIFPESLKSLTELSISYIASNSNLKLPKALDALKRLSIGDVYGQLSLPESLKSLTELSISYIASKSNLKLPKALDALKRLSIGDVYGQLSLPESLKSLTELSISYIRSDGNLKLPKALDALKRLSIGDVYGQLSLPESIKSLTELSISYIDSRGTFSISSTLSNLKKLFIKRIGKNSLDLLGSFEKLDVHKFTFGDIDADVSLKSTILQKAMSIRSALKSFCSIWHPELPNVISNAIFKNYDLKEILQLRLVSKGFCELMNYPKGLSAKAIVSFQCKQLYPSDEQSIKYKFMFAKNNSIETVLKIENPDDFEELKKLVLEKQNLFDQIDKIDLEKIEINNDSADFINQLLTELKNSASFPSLTNLTLGNICHESTVKFPDSLQKLTIGKVQENTTLQLPKELTILVIGDISNKVEFNLNLSNCENLKDLTIGNIGHDSTLIVTPMWPNSTSLFYCQIGTIWDGATLTLPSTLSDLEILELGDIWDNATVTISNERLKHLSIGNVLFETSLKLPEALDSLESLSIGDIGTDLVLPISLNNLSSLKIGNICNGAKLIFPKKLDTLKELIIGNVEDGCILELPSELPKLEKPSTGNIGTHASITWPEKFYSIQNRNKKEDQYSTILLNETAMLDVVKIR